MGSLEATVVCVDNSEWTRNGDYLPTRFQAQADAVNLLAGAKTQSNPESTVGVLTMAGKTPRVLVTPTPELGKVLNSMQTVEIEGESNLASAVQVAQLALKHRQNKNQRQRIVIFIGSPIREEKEKLVKIAKNLKKNNVAVDIVAFGNEEENSEKVQAFTEAVNSSDNSHLVTVPAGCILSDVLFGTPIFQGEGAPDYGAPPGVAGAGDGFEFVGVDPNLDPELALALRVSLEEERARQTAAAAAAAAAEGAAAAPAEGAVAAGGDDAAPAGDEVMGGGEDDELLQQALAMSMQVDQPQQEEAAAPAGPTEDLDMEDMDEDMRAALQMSLADSGMEQAFQEAVGGLPGVDLNDPDIQAAINSSLQKPDESKKEDAAK